MGIFGKSRIMDELKFAFSKVKNDINKLAAWNDYFKKKHEFHDDKIAYLTNLVSEERIKKIVKEALDEYNINPKQRKTVKERVLSKLTRQSKSYTTNSIFSLIQKYGKISAMQLRDIVVEEQGLCSKSTFYRLLEDIENSDAVSIVKHGKQKHYLAKLLPKTNK